MINDTNRHAGIIRFHRSRTVLYGIILCCLLTALSFTGCGGGAKQPSSAENGTGGDTAQNEIDSDTLQAVFFDVGKGDCILFTMDDNYVLLDAGYEETADDIVQELQERGINKLDAMIITHYDKDHVGGAAEIAQSIPVDTFYLPDYIGEKDKCGDLLNLIESKDLNSVRVSKEVQLSLGDAQIEIDPALIAYDAQLLNDNDASLIVSVFYGDDEWFLPGDIEKDAIDVWLDNNSDTFDILKMPHHGRKGGNTKKLIKNIDPDIAVITDSDDDPASEKILDQLDKKEVTVFRSAVDGNITITGNGSGKFEVTTD